MAERVNTKFIAIALSGVLALGVGGYVARHFVRGNPGPHKQLGDKYMAEGNLEQAEVEYATAFKLGDRRDPEVAWKLGNVLRALRKTSDQYTQSQVDNCYNAALEADPNYKPALESLLDDYAEDAKFNEDAERFTRLKDTAVKLLNLDPKNPKALTYEHIAAIMTWTYSQEPDPGQIVQDIDALHALMGNDPTNADLPLYVAKAYVNEGALAIRAESPAEAHEDFQRAISVFDEAIKNSPDNAMMYYDAFTIHRDIQPQDKQVTDKDASLARQKELLHKAIDLIKPDDTSYRQVYFAAQDFARQHGDPTWGEKLMRDWVAARPDDPYARLLLAQIVSADPKRREEAIQLLTQPSAANKPGLPPIADRPKLELAILIELCDLRLELYSSLDPKTDADRRTKLLADVTDGIQRAADRAGEDWRVTMLQGRLEMIKNGEGSVAAVKLFEKTLDLRRSQQNTDTNDAHKYRIMYWLACCYAAINQSGPAEANLYEVIDKARDYWPARLRLAQLLVQHGATLQAREQVDELWKEIPDNLDLIRVTLLVLDPNVDADRKRLGDLYTKLPENNRIDMIIKVNSAIRMGLGDEALRLSQAIWDKDTTDFNSLQRLVQVLEAMKKHDEAVTLATKAASDNGKDPRFELLLATLKHAPADQIDAILIKIIEADTDPHSRELQWFQFYNQRGKPDDAFMHLQAAEKLAPNDPVIMDLMFQHYCLLKDWNKAADYVVKLGNVNYDGTNGKLYQIELDKEEGKYEDELAFAHEVAKLFPEVARSWIAVGEAMMMNQQYDTAIQNYTLALEKQKDSAPAYRGLIDSSIRLGRLDDARRYLNSALKLHPDDAGFREGLIQVDLQTDPEKAIPPRVQAMNENPRSRDARVNVWQAYFKSAEFVKTKGQADQAAAYYKQARDVLQGVIDDPEWSDDPRLYGFLAENDVDMGDVDGGRKVLERLSTVPKWKDTAVPSVMLAQFYARCNKAPEAEAAWKDAMVKSNNAPDVTQQLATFYVQHNHVDDAIALLTPRITEPGIAPQLIEIEINSGHYAEAEHQLEKILDATPPGQQRDPLMVSWLGLSDLNQNKLPEAEALLSESIKGNPKLPMPHLWRANVKMKQASPDLDAALDDLKAATALDPNNVDVRIALAELYQRRDDMDSAMHELEQAVQYSPHRKDVRLRLIDMYINQQPARWVEVADLLDKARELDPADLDWITQQASVALQRGMNDAAEQRADELLKAAPDNPAVFREFLTILLRAKRYDRALTETDKAMTTMKDIPWWLHMGRGVAMAGLDRKDDAMGEFKTALDVSAGAPDADSIGTQVIQRMVEVIGPQRALEFALPQADSDDRWRLIAMDLYKRLLRYPEAAALADKLLADIDKFPEAERARITIQIAQIYISDKDVQKGVQLYRDLLAKNPDNVLALNNLAVALVDEVTPPQTQEALDCSTKMLQALPHQDALFSADRYNFLDTHGWVLVKSGRPQEGLPYLYAAANAHISVACYHLGVVLLNEQHTNDAHKWLQDAHDLIEKEKEKQLPVDPALAAAIDAQLSQF